MNNSLHILTDAEIQALWDEACKDSPQAPGWNRHIRFARALLSKLRAPVADGRAAGINPDECDAEVYKRGTSVGLFAIPKEDANAICAGIAAATGARVDWHYIAGRVHIKALPALASAPVPVLKDWRIDTSAGGPILVYKDCSVIESAQAEYVLRLIAADQASAPVAGEAQKPVAWMLIGRLKNSEPKFTLSDPAGIYESVYAPLYAAPQASAEPTHKPAMSVAEFCAEAGRLGLTADTLAAQLSQRPEFADCLPQADKDGGQQRARDGKEPR